MARQAGPIFFTGTIDDLVFYKLGEHYYVRQKGERTPGVKKRLKHDKGYALLQLKQAEFGHASELVKSDVLHPAFGSAKTRFVWQANRQGCTNATGRHRAGRSEGAAVARMDAKASAC